MTQPAAAITTHDDNGRQVRRYPIDLTHADLVRFWSKTDTQDPGRCRHACDTPACCNPDHLADGTQADNMRDAAERGRNAGQRKTHCPSGHPYDEANTRIYDGRRYCRTCVAECSRRRRANRKAEA